MEKILNDIYPIFLGEEALGEIVKVISQGKYSSIFILTDENVNIHCLPVLLSKSEELKNAFIIEIPPGEEEKNITISAKVISVLLENNADRKSLLINFGGGVIGDLGGFTASVYKRGICFINIPTTLLSMVDASVGGKNGINFLERKNIIGTFTNPEAVFIFPDFIKTLLPRETRSGYAEILKHILLSDEGRWKSIQNNVPAFLDEKNRTELISHSVKFKAGITKDDFKEESKRMILNFGHTIGHAIESFSYQVNEPLIHGEAIAAGMISELYLSKKLAGFPETEMLPVIRFIRSVFPDIHLNCNPEDLIPFLYADKKNSRDKIAFSLLKASGVPAGVVYPDLEFIVESLIFLNEEFSRVGIQ